MAETRIEIREKPGEQLECRVRGGRVLGLLGVAIFTFVFLFAGLFTFVGWQTGSLTCERRNHGATSTVDCAIAQAGPLGLLPRRVTASGVTGATIAEREITDDDHDSGRERVSILHKLVLETPQGPVPVTRFATDTNPELHERQRELVSAFLRTPGAPRLTLDLAESVPVAAGFGLGVQVFALFCVVLFVVGMIRWARYPHFLAFELRSGTGTMRVTGGRAPVVTFAIRSIVDISVLVDSEAASVLHPELVQLTQAAVELARQQGASGPPSSRKPFKDQAAVVVRLSASA